MHPVSPVVPGENLPEVIYAENQDEYKNLPVFKNDEGDTLSRWKLSLLERIKVLFTGNIYLWISTFNHPLQPVLLQVEKPNMEQEHSPLLDDIATDPSNYSKKEA